jgi:hypothetical protein
MNSCKYIVTSKDVLNTAVSDIEAAIKEHGTINLEWKVARKRSLSQNALFHVWCGEISSQMAQRSKSNDYTKKVVKLFLKKMFLGEEVIEFGKTRIEHQIRSSSSLDKGEMFQFMEQVLGWAIEHNFSLSQPEDSEFEKLRRSQYEV